MQPNFLLSELPQKQPLVFVSSELRFDPQEDVPDYSESIELSDFNLGPRFEVSPEHQSGETVM